LAKRGEIKIMYAYFVQLVPTLEHHSKRIILSGAVFAENSTMAEKLAIAFAKQYKVIKENNIELMVYTLIKLGGMNKLAQFGVHSDMSYDRVNKIIEELEEYEEM
jgi:hypothetical protein